MELQAVKFDIWAMFYGYEDETLRKLLNLNCERHYGSGENAVIKKKIFRYYFIGDFDLGPFMRMNVKRVPKVICLIDGDDHLDIINAIFRVIRAIPALTNFTA